MEANSTGGVVDGRSSDAVREQYEGVNHDMPAYALVTRGRHSEKAWVRFTDYAFAAEEALAPLVGAEAAHAALAFPMAFLEKDSQYALVAMLSPLPGRNLFVGPDGRWLGTYVPAAFRARPFALARPEGSTEAMLCVDEEGGLVVDRGTPNSIPFFDADGKPSTTLKPVIDFLAQRDANHAATLRATEALTRAGLLVPWPIRIQTEEDVKTLDSLYRLDETRLNGLDGAALATLRDAGALALAYAQLLSMGQIAVFSRLPRSQPVEAAAPPALKPAPAPVALQFNWDAEDA